MLAVGSLTFLIGQREDSTDRDFGDRPPNEARVVLAIPIRHASLELGPIVGRPSDVVPVHSKLDRFDPWIVRSRDEARP